MMDTREDSHRGADKFIEEMVSRTKGRADENGNPLWSSWALREAFLAGYERAQMLLFLHDKAVSDYVDLKQSFYALMHDYAQLRKTALDAWQEGWDAATDTYKDSPSKVRKWFAKG